MITTHVLDIAVGETGRNISIRFYKQVGDQWEFLSKGRTDDDGRLKSLCEGIDLTKGIYRLNFQVGEYLKGSDRAGFYDDIPIVFRVDNPEEHYHVPLLLSPYGYSTYRGS